MIRNQWIYIKIVRIYNYINVLLWKNCEKTLKSKLLRLELFLCMLGPPILIVISKHSLIRKESSLGLLYSYSTTFLLKMLIK